MPASTISGIWGARLETDFISNNLEFYEIRLKQLTGHGRRLYCFTRAEAACCIGENRTLDLPQQVPK
ncbi:MAG: hypothetical protein WB711_19155 [Terriglobales bacterium]